jgi:hypothetical protein
MMKNFYEHLSLKILIQKVKVTWILFINFSFGFELEQSFGKYDDERFFGFLSHKSYRRFKNNLAFFF